MKPEDHATARSYWSRRPQRFRRSRRRFRDRFKIRNIEHFTQQRIGEAVVEGYEPRKCRPSTGGAAAMAVVWRRSWRIRAAVAVIVASGSVSEWRSGACGRRIATRRQVRVHVAVSRFRWRAFIRSCARHDPRFADDRKLVVTSRPLRSHRVRLMTAGWPLRARDAVA